MTSNVREFQARVSANPSVKTYQDATTSRTIFHDDWWLKVASKGKIRQVEVLKDSSVVGSMSYVAVRRHGMTYVQTPPYTRLLGPLLSLPPSKVSTRIRNTR